MTAASPAAGARRWLARCLAGCLGALAALASTELTLRLLGLGQAEEKTWFTCDLGPGTCYSSPGPEPFGIDLRRPADLARLEALRWRAVPNPTLQRPAPLVPRRELRHLTPLCVLVNVHRRTLGPYPERPVQVGVLGDSFALGEGVEDEGSLGFLLSHRFPDANFRNYGNLGDDLAQIRAMARGLLQTSPEVKQFLYFFNLNDVFLDRPGFAPTVSVPGDLQALYLERSRPLHFSRLGSMVRRALLWRQQTEQTLQELKLRYLSRPERGRLQLALGLLAQIHEMIRRAGGHLQVVIYPLLLKPPGQPYPLQDVHRQLLDFCQRQGIPCVDGAPAFAHLSSFSGLRVHAVDGHPNRRANALLVDHLVLTRGICVPPPPAQRTGPQGPPPP